MKLPSFAGRSTITFTFNFLEHYTMAHTQQDWIRLWDEDVQDEWVEWMEDEQEDYRKIRREDRKMQKKLAHREFRRELRKSKARRS